MQAVDDTAAGNAVSIESIGERIGPAPMVDVMIPVFDEEAALGRSVGLLHAYLADCFPFTWRITIVDNASTDSTWAVAGQLVDTLDRVVALRLDRKGRGLALRTAWSRSATRRSRSLHGRRPGDWLDWPVAPWSHRWSRATPMSANASRLAPGIRRPGPSRREFTSRSCNTILAPGLRLRARCATPSAASRRCAPTWPGDCCRRSRTTGGSSTPSCCCSRTTTDYVSTSSPSTGSTTPTAASTWSANRDG